MFGDFDAICNMKNVKKRELDFTKAQKESMAGLLLVAKGTFKVFLNTEIMKLGQKMEKEKKKKK